MRSAAAEVARLTETPAYLYDLEVLHSRLRELRTLFPPPVNVSFAVKSNPSSQVLLALANEGTAFDASSIAEVEALHKLGVGEERISFSGPAKRPSELDRFIALGGGALVVESLAEARYANAAAARLGKTQKSLIRISPAWIPPKFGSPMSGRPSQFGIDEEVLPEALEEAAKLSCLNIVGFHILSGTGCLDSASLIKSYEYNIGVVEKAAARLNGALLEVVFGAGFGIPYSEGERELDVATVAAEFPKLTKGLRAKSTEIRLELGRWLVGPAGWFLTRVVSQKESRGVSYRACDGGFNNHLAACGMLGSVFRRNWKIDNLSNPGGDREQITLVGPLCTSIDVIARDIILPRVRVGDILAISNSGAYGLTASPVNFIAHPVPREITLGDLVKPS